MSVINIKEKYEEGFFEIHGKDITAVEIPDGTDYFSFHTRDFAYCPNIVEFKIGKDTEFHFLNGVLYRSKYDGTREIIYVTREVEHLHIDPDISDVSISDCHMVKSVSVDSENPQFRTYENMLINQDMTKLYLVFSTAEEVEIPEGIQEIDSYAFRNCNNLKRIVFPESYEWWRLRSGALSFDNLASSPDIIIHGDDASFEDDIIYTGLSLEPVVYFGDNEVCQLPDKVTGKYNIRADAFRKVKNFVVKESHSEFASEDGVILNKDKTELLAYPRAREYFQIPETVHTIGAYAVSGCDQLVEITIPQNVDSVDMSAFSGCGHLKTVHFINSSTKVADTAFAWCGRLEKVEGVPYPGFNVEKVDDDTLALKNGVVEIHPQVDFSKWIEDDGFVHTIILSESVQTIHIGVFPCENIEVRPNNPNYQSRDGVLFSSDMRELCNYPQHRSGKKYSVPEGVEIIHQGAFAKCQHLHSIILPDSIKHIEKEAFYDARIERLELPYTPVRIDEHALTPNTYYRYGGKDNDFKSKWYFRFKGEKIPLIVDETWRGNKPEIMLAEFIEGDEDEKQKVYGQIKKKEYKTFMAIYLYLVYGNQAAKKYLSSVKKRIKADRLYRDLLPYIYGDESF